MPGTPELVLGPHLHADGYAGFAELYESARSKPANVTEVACWAHVRRKFFNVHKANGSAIAREALDRIGALFDIERMIAGNLRTGAMSCGRAWPRTSSTGWPTGSTSS